MSPNLRAFLDMIAWSEIGPGLLAASDDGYNVIVGSTADHPILFTDYSHHPKLHNDRCNSDAAGRYQFMGRYWEFYRDQLHLPDFGRDSQDRWATQLIRECHALDDVEEGHVFVAIGKCCKRWASFEGAGYGQRENSAIQLAAAYRRAGGLSS